MENLLANIRKRETNSFRIPSFVPKVVRSKQFSNLMSERGSAENMRYHDLNWIVSFFFAISIFASGSLVCAQQSGAGAVVSKEASAEAYLSLTRPSLIENIGLTDEQSVVIRAEIRKYQTELRKLYGNFPPGAQDTEGTEIRQRLIDDHSDLRTQTVKKIAEILSPSQREVLVTLQRKYSDQEPVAAQPDASLPAILIEESSYTTWTDQRRGTIYQLQDYRDGAMQKLCSKDGSENSLGLDLQVNGSGVFVTIDGKQQESTFWHSEDRVISAVAVSPNGKRIATGTGWFPDRSNLKTPGEIRIWDVSSGKLLQKKMFSNDVYALGFRNDDTLLVVLSPRGGR
jgi:hypothetical protein